jgi:hypothetical protein
MMMRAKHLNRGGTRSTIANSKSKIENEIGPAWIRTRDQGIMSPLLYR